MVHDMARPINHCYSALQVGWELEVLSCCDYCGMLIQLKTIWCLYSYNEALQASTFTVPTNLQSTVQGFVESLQQECSKPAQNVMIELYCCGPDLLFWLLLFQ